MIFVKYFSKIIEFALPEKNKLFLFAAIFILTFISIPNEASAFPPPNCQPTDPGCNCDTEANIASTIQCCNELPGIFYRTENCLRNLLRTGVVVSLAPIINGLKLFVGVMMTLVTVFFGIKLATGSLGTKAKGDAIILMIKLCFVSWFILGAGINDYFNAIMTAGTQVAAIVTAPIFGGGTMWEQMDKVIFAFFGLATTPTGFLVILTIGFAILALTFIGPIGPMLVCIIVIGIGYIFMGFVMILYSAFLAMIAITILLMFAPLFVPFFLYNPGTMPRGLFDSWLKQVFTYSMQIVVITTFAILALVVMKAITGFGMTPPPVNSVLGMLETPPVEMKTIMNFYFFKLQIPVVTWDLATAMEFVKLLFASLVMGIAMFDFMRQLPQNINYLIGDFVTQPTLPGIAMQDMGSFKQGVDSAGSKAAGATKKGADVAKRAFKAVSDYSSGG